MASICCKHQISTSSERSTSVDPDQTAPIRAVQSDKASWDCKTNEQTKSRQYISEIFLRKWDFIMLMNHNNSTLKIIQA